MLVVEPPRYSEIRWRRRLVGCASTLWVHATRIPPRTAPLAPGPGRGGLGYVGLPLAVAFAEGGEDVVGVDVDTDKVSAIRAGESYIEDVSSEALGAVRDRLRASHRYADLAGCEAVVIAVPTPLTRNREPDLAALLSTARSLSDVLQEG